MKTLIFNGSPRKNGDTVSLINILTENLTGEIKTVNAYYDNIHPCVDCRYCWNHDGCAINDEMTEIYEYIKVCDNIIIASPIYFSEITGELLSVFSRLQTFWCQRFFRKIKPLPDFKKSGAVILCGGGDGSPKRASETCECILRQLNADTVSVIVSHNTNNVPAADDEKAVTEVRNLAKLLSSNASFQ